MAENSGIKFLKYYSQKLKSFFFSKDVLSFLLFLALSAAFWYINALGKERETILNIPIRYVGVPQYIGLGANTPTSVSLTVKDQGLRLFSYSNENQSPVTIDLYRTFYQKGEILITSDQLRSKIGRSLLATTSVLEIKPDSILIKYEKLSQKTLPIELVSSIELAPQYMLAENIRLEPNQVTVFGPRRILDKLKAIRTELVEAKNLSDTISLNCKLKSIPAVRFSSPDIKLSLFVEQFTEKKIQIPIKSINCPANLFIRTFPAVVNATFTVGLSHFNSLSSDDMSVYLEYNELKVGKSSKQKLKIANKSSHISNIRIVPQEVEFILEQK